MRYRVIAQPRRHYSGISNCQLTKATVSGFQIGGALWSDPPKPCHYRSDLDTELLRHEGVMSLVAFIAASPSCLLNFSFCEAGSRRLYTRRWNPRRHIAVAKGCRRTLVFAVAA
jgi:hypothetical protein